MNNIEFINSIPECSFFEDTKKSFFKKNSKAVFVERILQQLFMIFSVSEGGVFIFIGKKIS